MCGVSTHQNFLCVEFYIYNSEKFFMNNLKITSIKLKIQILLTMLVTSYCRTFFFCTEKVKNIFAFYDATNSVEFSSYIAYALRDC